MEKYINPTRIIKAEEAFSYENMLGEKFTQIPFIREGLEYGIAKDCTRVNDGGYILLDYGKELHGGIQVFVQSITDIDTKLRITFGESAMEALSPLNEKNSVFQAYAFRGKRRGQGCGEQFPVPFNGKLQFPLRGAGKSCIMTSGD